MWTSRYKAKSRSLKNIAMKWPTIRSDRTYEVNAAFHVNSRRLPQVFYLLVGLGGLRN